jgi:predicted ABC-type ATPase
MNKHTKKMDYQVTCLFFWLNSEELAISRVKTRVKEGGHYIPEDVIRRRYKSGQLAICKQFRR